jgi:uncharacterized protein YutD
MDTNWLSGGPYCEVSFIILNRYNDELKLNNLIERFSELQYKIEMKENELENKIRSFCNKENCNIELNIHINICGKQKSKIFIDYLSDEIMQIDYCFLEDKVDKARMKKLKNLLKDSMELFDGIVGMIGYETVCHLVLFETENTYPNKDYTIKKLKHCTTEYIENLSGVVEIVWRKNNGVHPNVI